MTVRPQTFRQTSRLERIARALPRTRPLAPVRRVLGGAYARLLGGPDGALRATLPGGESFLIDPEWRHITWNPDEYAVFRAAVRPGDVVIEAGANAGCYAVLFGLWVGPSGRVFAFEPDPRAFQGLARHIDLNGLSGRVVPVQAALNDRSGDLPFHLGASSGVSRLDAAAGGSTTSVVVRATTIDEFCAAEKISPAVIKIDVEGAELAVLRGAARTLRRNDVALFVELHPTLWGSSGVDPAAMARACAALGLRVDAPAGVDPWTTDGVCFRFRRS